MNETMGQIIRRLRRERGMTQEELAEILGVTFQAVSKWENDTGMPDISQVVPLAHVFGVTTDTILCVGETAPNVDAMQIYTNAMQNTRYGVLETYLSAFNKLKEGLDGKYCMPERMLGKSPGTRSATPTGSSHVPLPQAIFSLRGKGWSICIQPEGNLIGLNRKRISFP